MATNRRVMTRGRAVIDALEQLVGGLGTALLAFLALLWLVLIGLTCVVGVGLLLAPTVPRLVRSTAERERTRLSRWGPEVMGEGPAPAGLRAALADPAFRRELRWLPVHGTFGLFVGLLGLTMLIDAMQDVSYPLWWRLLPPKNATPSMVF